MIAGVVGEYTASEVEGDWDLDELVTAMEALYGTGVTAEELGGLDREAIIDEFLDDALDAYAEREKEIEGMQEGLMRDLERFIVLQVVDIRWREHLENMDYMREGIHLRGMAQKDPLVEYRNEGHVMFLELNRAIREEVVALLFHAQIEAPGTERRQRRGRSAAAERQRRRTGTSPTSTSRSPAPSAIAAAGGRDGDRGDGGGGEYVAPAAGRQVRAGEHRPQRPLLVRLGQEVQALPRPDPRTIPAALGRLAGRRSVRRAESPMRVEPATLGRVPCRGHG